jgi:hypothetical protein
MQDSAKSKAKDIDDMNLLKSRVPCGIFNKVTPKKSI